MNTTNFLKSAWPFFNIMPEMVKWINSSFIFIEILSVLFQVISTEILKKCLTTVYALTSLNSV